MRLRTAFAVALLSLPSCGAESEPPPAVVIDEAMMSVVRERLRAAIADLDSIPTPASAEVGGSARLVVCPADSGFVLQSKALRRWPLVEAARMSDVMDMTPAAGAASAAIAAALRRRGWVIDTEMATKAPPGGQFNFLRKEVNGYTITAEVTGSNDAIYASASVEQPAACSQATPRGRPNGE